jgi:hypothetical protein
MNDPFKEIADRTHFNIYNSPMWNPTGRRFAEEIIKECADLFLRVHTDEQYQRRIDKTIRKHFGIEE